MKKDLKQIQPSRRSFLMGSSALAAAGWIAGTTGAFVLKPEWAHAAGPIKMGIATDITGAIAAGGNSCWQTAQLPVKQIKGILKKYAGAKDYFWVQEEPENMGAWGYMLRKFPDVKLEYIGRRESSAPAAGSFKRHEIRVNKVYEQIFSHAKPLVTK